MQKIKFIYNEKSKFLCDCITQYDLDIEFWNYDHYKEKKKAIPIMVNAGTKLVPFLGIYNEDNELIDALWSDSIEIDEIKIENLIDKYLKDGN